MRNCGGTEHLSRGLYHSGLTADPRAVLEELRDRDGLRAFAVAGYSMGGNVTMKLAGELGATDFPEVKAFAAVSPVIELEACVQSIERRENRIYEWNFCRNLQARMRRKARAFPGAFDLDGAVEGVVDSRVRRSLYGAASWLQRRGGLLPSRQRDARDRSRGAAGARSSAPPTIRSCRRVFSTRPRA